MESKYAEKALKILNSIAKPKNVKNNALLTDEVLKAMCKLANEVEKDKVNELLLLNCDTIRTFLNGDEFNPFIKPVISGLIQLLYSNKEFILKGVELSYDKSKLYTKEQVEELLQKQRELCAEKARFNMLKNDKIICELLTYSCSEDIHWFNMNKDSILNAKLKLE